MDTFKLMNKFDIFVVLQSFWIIFSHTGAFKGWSLSIKNLHMTLKTRTSI